MPRAAHVPLFSVSLFLPWLFILGQIYLVFRLQAAVASLGCNAPVSTTTEREAVVVVKPTAVPLEIPAMTSTARIMTVEATATKAPEEEAPRVVKNEKPVLAATTTKAMEEEAPSIVNEKPVLAATTTKATEEAAPSIVNEKPVAAATETKAPEDKKKPVAVTEIKASEEEVPSAVNEKPNLVGVLPSTPVVSKKKISVVLRTWREDAELAILGLKSVLDVMGPFWVCEIVIVTDLENASVVRDKLFKPLRKIARGSSPIPIRFKVEDVSLFNGHIQQKYSKMTADTYTTGDYILHIDSDCAVVRWNDSCFLKNGKPVNDFDKFENLPGSGVHIWQNGTQKALGIEYEPYEFSRLNQHVYPRDLYKVLRDRVEKVHGVSFRDAFEKLGFVGRGSDLRADPENRTLISDFNLLGATSYHFAPDLMYQKNLRDEAWRPICVIQCNARRYTTEICQTWIQNQTDTAKAGGNFEYHFAGFDRKISSA